MCRTFTSPTPPTKLSSTCGKQALFRALNSSSYIAIVDSMHLPYPFRAMHIYICTLHMYILIDIRAMHTYVHYIQNMCTT